MTTCLRLSLYLNVLVMAVSPAEGFGARLGPFSAHHGGYSSRGVGSNLRLYESRQTKQQENTAFTETILDLFDFPPAAYEDLNDFVVAYSTGVADGTFSHLQEKADSLALETFAENLAAMDPKDDGCGEDCEECLIPEEWKKLPTMMESVDVMEFLGITRVKSLKAPVAVSRDAR